MIKRRLSEIIAAARLEPSTGVVLVEGRLDRNIIRDFVRSQQSTWAVYDCNIIENDLFTDVVSNYREVLSRFSGVLSEQSVPNVLCVVDSDFDIALGEVNNEENLAKTDFATFLLYGLDADVVRAIGRVTGIFIEEIELDCIVYAARVMFFLRFKKYQAQLNHKMPNYEKAVYFENNCIKLRLEECERLLSILSSDNELWKPGLSSLIESMFDAPDFRFVVNDHDIAFLISSVLKKKSSKNIMSSDDVLEIFAANIKTDTEPLYPLFNSLRDKIRCNSTTKLVARRHSAPAPAA